MQPIQNECILAPLLAAAKRCQPFLSECPSYYLAEEKKLACGEVDRTDRVDGKWSTWSRGSLSRRGLDSVELRVRAALGQEILVATGLDDARSVEDHDEVGP